MSTTSSSIPSSVPPLSNSAPLPSFRSQSHLIPSAHPLPSRAFSHSPSSFNPPSLPRPLPSPSQSTSSHSRSHSNPPSLVSTPSSDQLRRSSEPIQAASVPIQASTAEIEMDDFWKKERKNNEMERLANRYRREGMGVVEDWAKSCWPNGPGGRRSEREEELQRGREGIGQLQHHHETMGIGEEEGIEGVRTEIEVGVGKEEEEVEEEERKERPKLRHFRPLDQNALITKL